MMTPRNALLALPPASVANWERVSTPRSLSLKLQLTLPLLRDLRGRHVRSRPLQWTFFSCAAPPPPNIPPAPLRLTLLRQASRSPPSSLSLGHACARAERRRLSVALLNVSSALVAFRGDTGDRVLLLFPSSLRHGLLVLGRERLGAFRVRCCQRKPGQLVHISLNLHLDTYRKRVEHRKRRQPSRRWQSSLR